MLAFISGILRVCERPMIKNRSFFLQEYVIYIYAFLGFQVLDLKDLMIKIIGNCVNPAPNFNLS